MYRKYTIVRDIWIRKCSNYCNNNYVMENITIVSHLSRSAVQAWGETPCTN